MTPSEPIDLSARRLARPAPGSADSPVAAIPWASLDPARPWLPETLVSLHGLAVYDSLPAAARARLAQVEFLAFTELGLRLEALMIAGLGRGATRALATDPARYAAELAEIREEAGHSLMFLELRRRADPALLAPLPPWPASLRLAAKLVTPRGILFWAAVLVGESVAADLNRRIAADHALPAAVRAIAALHYADEARHVAYARRRLECATKRAGRLRRACAAKLLVLLLARFTAIAFLPSAAIYRAAGLDSPQSLARAVRASTPRAALAAQAMAPALGFLAKLRLA